MFGVYLFALIYGFGVVIVDLLGLIGSDSDTDAVDGDDIGDGVGEDAGDGGDDGLDADDDAVVLPDNRRGKWVYRFLNILRSTVYFALGFGAVGVFGHLTGKSVLVSLPWAVGTGIVVLVLVKLIMRLQTRVVDSQLKTGELLFAEAEVLVSIPPGKLGRIRVKSGGSYHDLFAKGQDSSRVYPVGERVYVVDLSGSDPVVHIEK